MSKFGGCGASVVAMLWIAGACWSRNDHGKPVVPGTGGVSGSGTGGVAGNGTGGTVGAGGSGTGGTASGGAGGKDAGSPPDAGVCCPPDPLPIDHDSVHMGGAAKDGVCFVTYFAYRSCVTNWRVETDDQGCPILRVDYLDCPQSRNDARPPDTRDAGTTDAD